MYVKRYMLRLWKTRVRPSPPFAHGEPGVVEAGHRRYVGGTWEEGGRIQFDFLRREGLAPHHVLLDIGCGSLRAGVHLIPYLEPGHYLGLDKEPLLLERAISEEFDREMLLAKKPQFVVSSCFEFDRFDTPADYALAQSVFTHLPPREIELCLRNLRAVSPPHLRFFASWRETKRPLPNPKRSHDHLFWYYTATAMQRFGERTGWSFRYIGEWGHPRQMMLEFRPA